MKEVRKLDFLDGLKVLSCLMIFNFHFNNFFYPGSYSLLPEHYHMPDIEYLFGSTPLNLLMGGKYGVRIFMTLSGFFVGYRFFITGDKSSLKSGAVKKYFRLILPIIAANILIFILMSLGLFKNDEASVFAHSEVFVANYNTFAPNFFAAMKEAVWGCFVTGENQYNGPLWFIYYEFFGTLLIAAILSLVGESKVRYIVYGVAALIFIRSDFLPFVLGTVVCDLTYQTPAWLEKINKQKWLMALLMIGALFLGSFPPIGERMEGTIYQFFPLKIILYYNVAASMIVYAVLQLKTPAKLLGNKLFTWFNQYTYGFYLTHFTVLCTFSCGLFLALKDSMNYHVLALINYVLSFVLSTLISIAFHKWIEKPGMKLSAKVGAYFDKH